jgi:hypothetical protein
MASGLRNADRRFRADDPHLHLPHHHGNKKPAPNFSEAGFADLPLDRRLSEYARGHGKFSVVVFVGGECRRGSCRDASGGE